MRIVFIVFGVLAVLNVLAWSVVYNLSQARLLEVIFFDVGQGDAIFIESPQGHQILIDGGPDPTVLEKLGKEMPFWDRTIDLIILTHPDQDHITGLIEVLKRYKVDNILWTGVLTETAEFKEWQKLIGEEEAQIEIARAGWRITGAGMIFNLLHPFEKLEGETAANTNDTSVVVRLVFGENSFLFLGDIYGKVEEEIMARREIDSDVLKVSHHGSKTSTAREFVEAVSPSAAIISAGKDNRYGHPHQETLDNLRGIEIFRTDIDGDIRILSDGTNLQIK